MDRNALRLLIKEPARVARWCGLEKLSDALHGPWLAEMIGGREDFTLLAHRGSYKTSCIAAAMATLIVTQPRKNILFLRKTDDDVTEIIRLVKLLIDSEAMRNLSARLYGTPVTLTRHDMHSLSTSAYAATRGAQQLVGQGIGGSLTGKHADFVFTDDIVNAQDRYSDLERQRTRLVYQELQNIRNPGGRIINAGTPWHPDDAIALMPDPQRWDVYRTGLLSPERIEKLRQVMSPSLFAANYELKHLAREEALLQTAPRFFTDPALLRDGVAHIDAAYGGSDYTALTCAQYANGQIYVFGKLWKAHVNAALEEALRCCDELMCSPVMVETNGDKGYLVRELRRRQALVRAYNEREPKISKITSRLLKWWPRIQLLEGTDQAYVDQLLGYHEHAAHDDAPDSLACVLRHFERWARRDEA